MSPRFGSWQTLMALLLLTCAVLPLGRAASEAPVRAHGEWPREWDGRALRPLALSAVEQRFADRFPGRLARFTDGERIVVLREVEQPTRMLHPAADCYRGLGYRIEAQRLERDAQQRLWRCFAAVQGDHRLRVCERIQAAGGEAFTDASNWFWAAALNRSRGPWLAITQVEFP